MFGSVAFLQFLNLLGLSLLMWCDCYFTGRQNTKLNLDFMAIFLTCTIIGAFIQTTYLGIEPILFIYEIHWGYQAQQALCVNAPIN